MKDIALFDNMKPVERIFEVTQEVYDAFQCCSGDHNPLHTDEDFARSKGFSNRVMYGNILNAFVSTLVGECLPTKEVMITSQDITYRLPVYMGDVLSAQMVVTDTHDSVGAVELKFSFRNDAGKTVARGNVQIRLI